MSLEINLVNAAIDIFKEKGVKFTMDDLANKLGVSKRTIYETIKSKEELLNSLVDEVFDSINNQQQIILNDTTLNDIEKLKKVFNVLPTSFNTIDYKRIYEVNKFYPKVYEKLNYRLESGWEPTENLINNCIENGIIQKVDVIIIKNMLIGSIRNLLEDNLLYKSDIEYKDALEKVVDIIFNGLVIKKVEV